MATGNPEPGGTNEPQKKLKLDTFMKGLIRRNPQQPEFHQAVGEVAESLIPFINRNPDYLDAQILERLTEPDRIVSFRVCWEDDEGNVRTKRGYRVQFSNAIGPYIGGLRFHPSENLLILEFLGFEQIFKNSLTPCPWARARGGADLRVRSLRKEGEIPTRRNKRSNHDEVTT